MSSAFNIALLVAVAALVVGWFWLRAGTTPGADARELVRDGAVLVDVRTPQELPKATSKARGTFPSASSPLA